MPTYRVGRIDEIRSERRGLQRVTVILEGTDSQPGAPERAYVLTGLVGPVRAGDEVVCNTTAVDRGLGTGGWHVIHANLTRPDWSEPGGGHVMKLRYTGVQVDTGVDEEHDPDLDPDLGGLPVVACSVHSQMGVVAATIAALRPGTRVAYAMTDGGALPLALSDLVADLVESGLLVGTVTSGHAFGGDLEAVTVASSLALARHRLDAEVVVAGMGLGGVGTGSRLGFSGLDQASILDAAAWLGGRPVACVRASSADGRTRHRGVSHHTRTVLDATRSGVEVPMPEGLEPGTIAARHRIVTVEPPDAVAALESAGITVTTMGRGPAEDPLFFAASAAAAAHALDLLVP